MAGLKNYLVIVVMVLVEGLEGVEEDNMAMESMVDDDYDFAAFLAKAGEVLGDPHGGDSWGNRVEDEGAGDGHGGDAGSNHHDDGDGDDGDDGGDPGPSREPKRGSERVGSFPSQQGRWW